MRHLISLILALGFVGAGAGGMIFFFAAGWDGWTIMVAGAVLVFSALWLYAELGIETPFERNSDAPRPLVAAGVAGFENASGLVSKLSGIMQRKIPRLNKVAEKDESYAQGRVMGALSSSPPVSGLPVATCPKCLKPMRIKTIEASNAVVTTTLACEECGTEAIQKNKPPRA